MTKFKEGEDSDLKEIVNFQKSQLLQFFNKFAYFKLYPEILVITLWRDKPQDKPIVKAADHPGIRIWKSSRDGSQKQCNSF